MGAPCDHPQRRPPELLKGPLSKGLPVLRNAIANHLGHRGIAADPEHIVVGSGAEHLYGLIVTLLDETIVRHRKILVIRKFANSSTITVPTSSLYPRPRRVALYKLNKVAADVHLLAHHFRRVMTLGRRRELLNWLTPIAPALADRRRL